MRKKGIFLVLVVILVAAFSTAANAEAPGPVVVTATVPSAVAITDISDLSLALDVTIGSQVTTPLTMTVKSNDTWSLTVSKNQDLTKGTDVIPSARLVYDASVAGGFGDPVSNAQFGTVGLPSDVIVDQSGDPTTDSGKLVTVNYKLTTNFDDPAGAYTATHTYTAATP